jgi:glycosidase
MMKKTILYTALLAAALAPAAPVFAASAAPAGAPYVKFEHAGWTRNATVYQINTRQFTPEGTLRAAERALPRLAELGVGILWLMPIHPIGEAKRKGALGSPYAVRDYRAVNPELGSLQDLRSFVDSAHRLGMHVILDWVGNHTSWDNALLASHPDWYARDRHGKPHPTPWYDWDDIIDLDYGQPGLRRYMADAMAYWVKEAGIDGYRLDAAGLVPLDFWEETAARLRAIKPVFLLAEWESRDLHARAFDATYAWSWWDTMKNIAEGKQDASALHTYYAWNEKFYPAQAYRLLGTSNHDKNAWEGTEFEIFGPAVEAAAVFSFVSSGMPMIYNGQEAGNRKRLAFFERDPIAWQPASWDALYRKLIALKKDNRALWNGADGGAMQQVRNGDEKRLFSFVRERGGQRVFAVFNFSGQAVEARFDDDLQLGAYRDFADGAAVTVDAGTRFTMAPWSYRVLVR